MDTSIASKGLGKGTPCLEEDVISTSIVQLVSNEKLDLIKSSRNNLVPSHVLYVDDILFFLLWEDV